MTNIDTFSGPSWKKINLWSPHFSRLQFFNMRTHLKSALQGTFPAPLVTSTRKSFSQHAIHASPTLQCRDWVTKTLLLFLYWEMQNPYLSKSTNKTLSRTQRVNVRKECLITNNASKHQKRVSENVAFPCDRTCFSVVEVFHFAIALR